jgi:hypothetical protein
MRTSVSEFVSAHLVRGIWPTATICSSNMPRLHTCSHIFLLAEPLQGLRCGAITSTCWLRVCYDQE